jgi:peptidoglycan/LPS O-acetylase OafA/YrhL
VNTRRARQNALLFRLGFCVGRAFRLAPLFIVATLAGIGVYDVLILLSRMLSRR